LNQQNFERIICIDLQYSPDISGVPQGTVLGPVLFLLHIADIARNVSYGTKTSSYVDDTRANRNIKDHKVDCEVLQEVLASIYEWAEDVNIKFECLRFWPGRSEKPQFEYLSPENFPIEEKLHPRDLGVEISSGLTFAIHIVNTVTSASRLVGWSLRTFRRRSKLILDPERVGLSLPVVDPNRPILHLKTRVSLQTFLLSSGRPREL
jgi:hypothetical protein